jgi:hypothetical protein
MPALLPRDCVERLQFPGSYAVPSSKWLSGDVNVNQPTSFVNIYAWHLLMLLMRCSMQVSGDEPVCRQILHHLHLNHNDPVEAQQAAAALAK